MDRLTVIRAVYAQWEREQGAVSPDPQYVRTGDSQYPEGVVALSAGAAADADLHRRVDAALVAAGLPVRV
jgi:hypothetical protein